MQTFTLLETCVLDEICAVARGELPRLSEFISSAAFLRRENTGHGFYTYFSTNAAFAELVWPQPICGPHARMIGMGDDAIMGFLLWCSGNKPSALEGFQYGDARGETVDLKTWDLANLRFDHFEWDDEVEWTKPRA